MYVSFRLSSDFAPGRVVYALLMTAFIIVVSFLSAFVCVFWLWLIFLYPFWLLSFPFYLTPKPFRGYWGAITSYNINFLWVEIGFIPTENVLVNGFSFFLLINLVGAMVGYWLSKNLLNESFKRELFDFFFRSGIWSFLVCYIIFFLDWFALGLTAGHEVNNIWSTIIINIPFFCKNLFWIPAAIATTIYGIYDRHGREEQI